jgi:hypothetical protein
MYYTNGPEIDPKISSTRDDNSKVILISVVGTLAVIGLLAGVFWWGQNNGKNTTSSSSSVASLSLSVGSSSASSASSTSSVASSSYASSSSASQSTIKTFSNAELGGFGFKYDSSIWGDPSIGCFYPSEVCVKELGKNITLSKKDSQAQLTMRLASQSDYPYGPVQLVCYTTDETLDIGSNWMRTRDPNSATSREFLRTTSTQSGTPPLAANRSNCDRTGIISYAAREISIGNIFKNAPTYLNVYLNFSGDNRGIADEIVKTITY